MVTALRAAGGLRATDAGLWALALGSIGVRLTELAAFVLPPLRRAGALRRSFADDTRNSVNTGNGTMVTDDVMAGSGLSLSSDVSVLGLSEWAGELSGRVRMSTLFQLREDGA